MKYLLTLVLGFATSLAQAAGMNPCPVFPKPILSWDHCRVENSSGFADPQGMWNAPRISIRQIDATTFEKQYLTPNRPTYSMRADYSGKAILYPNAENPKLSGFDIKECMNGQLVEVSQLSVPATHFNRLIRESNLIDGQKRLHHIEVAIDQDTADQSSNPYQFTLLEVVCEPTDQ